MTRHGCSTNARLRAAAAAALLACPPSAPASILARVDELLAAVQTIARVERRQEVVQPRADLSILGDRTQTAPILPGESVEDTGPQFLVKAKARTPWIEVVADSQFYYTSNFTLNEENTFVGEEDTVVLLSTAQFTITPEFKTVHGSRINPRVGFRHQWYNYDIVENEGRNNNFDFDAQTIFGEFNWWFPGDEWRLFVGCDYLRLLGHEPPADDYEWFYKETVPLLGADRFFRFGESAFLQVRLESQFHLTDVDPQPDADINDRFEHSLTFNFAWAVTPTVVLRPWYRFTYMDYVHGVWGDRNDTIHNLGITLTWRPFPWLDLRTYFSYDHKDSDDELVPDYRKYDVGPGFMAAWTF